MTAGAAGLEDVGAVVPIDGRSVELRIGRRAVRLTNLDKVFWPKQGLTKGDLLRYYATVSPHLLPHLKDRAMVMKRYPHGIGGEFFFMKRAPSPRPDWIRTVAIEHRSKSVIDFPLVQDLPSLLWVVNLGCIDLNQWYARCDDVDRPDYVHFDLDPTPGAAFAQALEAAAVVRDGLAATGMPAFAKTTGSRGIHVYVPIVRGPTQKQVWTFAKAFSKSLADRHSGLLTSVYRVADRPRRRVLVDYNQNAWGRTLASVYSVRPTPQATVSAPVTWKEVERGVRIEDFTMQSVPGRLEQMGDLFAPLLARKGRVKLEQWL
jgi:bifunctional non-homologous end joining protein LigD